MYICIYVYMYICIYVYVYELYLLYTVYTHNIPFLIERGHTVPQAPWINPCACQLISSNPMLLTTTTTTTTTGVLPGEEAEPGTAV